VLSDSGDEIEVDFALDSANLKLSFKGADCRERALRTRGDFLRLLEPYETLNRLMHPGPLLSALGLTLLLCLFASTVATTVMKALGEGPNIRYEWLILCIAAFPALFAIYR
jgi:hypothetical protein